MIYRTFITAVAHNIIAIRNSKNRIVDFKIFIITPRQIQICYCIYNIAIVIFCVKTGANGVNIGVNDV